MNLTITDFKKFDLCHAKFGSNWTTTKGETGGGHKIIKIITKYPKIINNNKIPHPQYGYKNV